MNTAARNDVKNSPKLYYAKADHVRTCCKPERTCALRSIQITQQRVSPRATAQTIPLDYPVQNLL